MTVLKNGDRVRLSTGVEAVCISNYSDDYVLETLDGDDLGWLSILERVGVTWELVEPELVDPVLVEPPEGSVIRFKNRTGATRIAMRNPYWSSRWLVDHIEDSFDWAELIERYGFTEFEVLRPEHEVVEEILTLLRVAADTGERYPLEDVAKEYGVEL